MFGNSGNNRPGNTFVSPDFAKCWLNVIRIRIKWLTARTLFTDEIMRILIRNTRITRTLFNLFYFYPDTDVRKLIQRRGIAALFLFFSSLIHVFTHLFLSVRIIPSPMSCPHSFMHSLSFI